MSLKTRLGASIGASEKCIVKNGCYGSAGSIALPPITAKQLSGISTFETERGPWPGV
jgi:hypothetical protein